MSAERPNFYLLLELDPSIDDWAMLEPRIVEKQRAWSHDRSMGNPKARRRAESSLALLPEIRAVLADPEARRQEAKAAVREQQKEKQERTRELDEMIAVLKSGGGPCSEAQVQKLVQQLAGAFTADEIKRRLRAAGVPLGNETGPERSPRPAKETIDKVTAGSIRQNLDHLQLATLYQFLELSPRSSPKALSDRAEEIYWENQRLGKTDAHASARNALAGICKSLFQSDRAKEKYDNYLAVEAMDQLKPALELAGGDNFISREELDALIKQARQRGVSAEDARAYIENLAATRKWGIQRDAAALPSESFKLCGLCSTLAPAAAARCPSCGEPLEMDCPRCGVRNPSANAACQSCGSQIGDAPLVKALVKEGERLVVEGDFAGALRSFDKALLYWPAWKTALEARQRAEGKRCEREGALAAIDELARSRKLIAARSSLDRFERAHGAAGLEDLRRRVQEGLARAEALYQEGEKRRRAGDSEAALERYEEALTACADFEPALRTMAASPPPPPTALRVTPANTGFRLTWQPPATARSLTFQVVRKAGGAPHGVDDGECLAEVRGAALDDTSAAVGTPWFYAVFSQRGGVSCHHPATSGPHLRTAEVEDLELVSGNGEVTLSWTVPPGCRRVEVWRRQSSPPGGHDGTALTVAGASAQDTGLTNGLLFGYRVVAVFADPLRPGSELRTSGRTATATPVAPPAPVLDLTASRTGRNVLLRWSPVAGSTVQIRQTSRPPDATPGLVLPASQADRFGNLVPGTTGNGAQVTLTGQGRVFFIPLSVAAGTAVVGAVAEVTTLDPVQQLQVRRSGPHLAMTWEWPEGTEEVLVAWAHDRHLEDPRQEQGGRVRVTRREYDRSGCWLLQNVERRPHYISVFAKTPQGDLYAQPARTVETLGQGTSVAYRVGVKKSLLRRSVEDAWLELTSTSGDGMTLPPLVVVGKAHAVPLSPRDGEVLLEVPGLQIERGRALLPLPAHCWPGRPYVKLFFKDAAAAREIRLLPAEKERLQIA
jgi:tetratricopeptide (TPR) repeat protein